jgi:hypothetical protein
MRLVKFNVSDFFKKIASDILLEMPELKRVFHTEPYASNDSDLRRLIGGSQKLQFGYLKLEGSESGRVNSYTVSFNYYQNLEAFKNDLSAFNTFSIEIRDAFIKLSSFDLELGESLSGVIVLNSNPPVLTVSEINKFLGSDIFYCRVQFILSINHRN